MDQNIVQTVTVIILAIIAFSAGIWSWWFTNHDGDADTTNDKEVQNN